MGELDCYVEDLDEVFSVDESDTLFFVDDLFEERTYMDEGTCYEHE